MISQATTSDPKFTPNDGQIKSQLQAIHTAEKSYIADGSLINAEAYVGTLNALEMVLKGYDPKNHEGNSYIQMKEAADEYLGYIKAEKSNLDRVLRVLRKNIENA